MPSSCQFQFQQLQLPVALRLQIHGHAFAGSFAVQEMGVGRREFNRDIFLTAWQLSVSGSSYGSSFAYDHACPGWLGNVGGGCLLNTFLDGLGICQSEHAGI